MVTKGGDIGINVTYVSSYWHLDTLRSGGGGGGVAFWGPSYDLPVFKHALVSDFFFL